MLTGLASAPRYWGARRELWNGFDGESEADGLGDGNQGGEARVAADGQCTVKARAFDAGRLGNFGDALSLGEVAQGNQQNAGFVLIFKCRFKGFGGKSQSFRSRRTMAPSWDTLALRFLQFRHFFPFTLPSLPMTDGQHA